MSKFNKLSKTEMRNVTGGDQNPNCHIVCWGVGGIIDQFYTASCIPDPVEQCHAIYKDYATTSATCSCNPPA